MSDDKILNPCSKRMNIISSYSKINRAMDDQNDPAFIYRYNSDGRLVDSNGSVVNFKYEIQDKNIVLKPIKGPSPVRAKSPSPVRVKSPSPVRVKSPSPIKVQERLKTPDPNPNPVYDEKDDDIVYSDNDEESDSESDSEDVNILKIQGMTAEEYVNFINSKASPQIVIKCILDSVEKDKQDSTMKEINKIMNADYSNMKVEELEYQEEPQRGPTSPKKTSHAVPKVQQVQAPPQVVNIAQQELMNKWLEIKNTYKSYEKSLLDPSITDKEFYIKKMKDCDKLVNLLEKKLRAVMPEDELDDFLIMNSFGNTSHQSNRRRKGRKTSKGLRKSGHKAHKVLRATSGRKARFGKVPLTPKANYGSIYGLQSVGPYPGLYPMNAYLADPIFPKLIPRSYSFGAGPGGPGPRPGGGPIKRGY
jgi:hypothetical protein